MATAAVPEAPSRARPVNPSRDSGMTYEEWRRLPATNQRQEVIDGEIVVSPAPSVDHQWVSGDLFSLLREHVRKHALGVVLSAPLDIVIQKTPRLRTRQPDISYFSTDRTGFAKRSDVRGIGAMEVAPDLVVEFLSPEEPRRTLDGKLADYASIGVTEVWLVGTSGETIEILELHGGAYVRAGLFGAGDVVTSTVLDGLDLPVDRIFEE